MYNSNIASILSGINNVNIEKEIISNDTLSNKTQKIEKALGFIKENIGFCEFKGATDGYWKDLETKDTKVMIFSIPNGTFITTPDNPKKEYSSEDVNGNFLILDGLLYKSNTDRYTITYMKV